jgi:hypothetical protein
MYLAIRNWNKYQHYQRRQPPWIKLYISLLDDDEIQALPVPTRLLWVDLLLLAARTANAIPDDREAIAKSLKLEPEACREGIDQLLKGRWIVGRKTTRRASKRASKNDPPETETEKDPPSPPAGGLALNAQTGCTHQRCRGQTRCQYE